MNTYKYSGSSYSRVQVTVMLELVALLAPATLMAETLISSAWPQTLLLTDRRV